jgi:hypothetical protein
MISRCAKSQPKYRLIKPKVYYKRSNVKSDTHIAAISMYAINPPSTLRGANAASVHVKPIAQVGSDPRRHAKNSEFKSTLIINIQTLLAVRISIMFILPRENNPYAINVIPITAEPVYNDIGLYETSYITSDFLWYQPIPPC